MIQSIEVAPDIVLARIAAGDATPLFELVEKNRLHLRQWLPWLDFMMSSKDLMYFIDRVSLQAEQHTGLVMLIHYRQSVVGVIGFNSIDHLHRVCEIGYWLDVDHQGLGIVTRSTERLIDFAFQDLKLNKVSIPVATQNTKSRSIPEKLGFQIEGVSREAEWLYDHYVDHALYAILLSEWNQRSAAKKAVAFDV